MKILFKTALATGLVAVSLFGSATVLADQNKGLELAKLRKQADSGWQDSQATLTMELKNAAGDTSVRKLRIKSLEVANDGDKGLTIFDTPRDVKGTAFLNHSHAIEPDDQWLYLPALKRVKRIASRNKSGPFMGSEFAYEDLSSFELEKYTFNFIAETTLGDQPVYLLEQIPVDRYSGYTKQRVWLAKTHYQPLKVEYYDRKDTLLKTLELQEYQLYLDKIWRANKLVMNNVQTQKATTLTTTELVFKTGLQSNDFNKASLKRAR
ncbi:outer membrane lipoprotein-sorting protein [Pseudoalteromonas luteoviolacea]|uniref:Outer membrane lipoprotein-sorting protein n=1 Tax=Pseudoalteromonas luteoviolacea TaxID=43657 RepID=A0A1C0TMF5_9GAMM|nr:outer membrane lipoprotein-sorting protein [Pseudoalteromonas luteoviolacea]OCQ20001.1 outer membrane lipoprotein-sorting protein [Pseudoalteromonas luteoviolacea]